MAITSIRRDWGEGPSLVRMTATDDLSTITGARYLINQQSNIVAINGGTFSWYPSDLILIFYEVDQWSFFKRNEATGALSVVIGGDQSGVTPQEVQDEAFTYSVATGPVNAYVAHLSPAVTTLTAGLVLQLKINITNTSTTPTVTIDGNTLTVVDITSSAIEPGDMIAGGISWLVYDGTNLQLLNPAVSTASPLTPADIQFQAFTYAADSGTTNAIVLSFNPPITSYSNGLGIEVKMAQTNNSETVTIDVDGLGPVSVFGNDFNNVLPGTLVQSGNYRFVYNSDGPGFILETPALPTTAGAQGIQAQQWTYEIDTSTGPDAYVVDYTPAMATTNGTIFYVLINGTGTNTINNPTVTVNGNTYDVYLETGNNIQIGDIIAGGISAFQILNGSLNLLNPIQSTGVTAFNIQSQTYNYSVTDTGTVNDYVGAYSPSIASFGAGTQLSLLLANTNTSTTVTFDCGDGSGPTPVLLGNGSPPPVGSMPAGLNAIFTYNGTNWQIVNPILTAPTSTTSVQLYATGLAPFVFTNTTNIVYVFDVQLTLNTPVVYDGSGNFLFPSNAASFVWEIFLQLTNTTGTVDNVRLEITAPFTNTIAYVYPLTVSVGQQTFLFWRQSIADNANVQVQFDASVAGQFSEGLGIDNTLISQIVITKFA